MRRLIITFLLFCLILVGAYFLAMLFAPKNVEFSVSRSFNKSPKYLQNILRDIDSWPTWSPFFEEDSKAQKVLNASTSKNVKWDNGVNVELIEETENTLKFRFETGEGLETKQGEIVYTITEESGRSRVLCEYTLDMHFLKKYKHFLNRTESNDQLVASLQKLEDALSKSGSSNFGVEVGDGVSITNAHSISFAVVSKDNFNQNDTRNFIDTAFNGVYSYMQTNGLSPKGPPCLLIYAEDEYANSISFAAGVPISEKIDHDEKWIAMANDSCLQFENGISYVLKGDIGQINQLQTAMNSVIDSLGKTKRFPEIHELIVGPMHTSRKENYKTKIWMYFE